MSYTSWDSLKQPVFRFLDIVLESRQEALLGLSGGPDSICLYHLLLDYKKSRNFSFHTAHIDHGWRRESYKEAQQLARMVEGDNIPFHACCLQKGIGATEVAAREKRLEFFAGICREYGLQGVLLAHHADDQAETVLKRLFEGSSLCALSAMKPVVEIDGLRLLRPLLCVQKKGIIKALKEKKIEYFIDKTNFDPRYLRSRMRQGLIPYLNKEFGKQIAKPVASIAAEAEELGLYLDEQTQPYIDRYCIKGMGGYLDLSDCLFTPKLILKHILRRLLALESFCFSKDMLQKMVNALSEYSANQRFENKEKNVLIDRGRVFIPKREVTLPDERLELVCGTADFGPWELRMEKINRVNQKASNFIDVWRGKAQVYLPEGEFFLRKHRQEDKLHDTWTNSKVPAFLRHLVPVITDEILVLREFLTGKTYDSVKPRYRAELILRSI